MKQLFLLIIFLTSCSTFAQDVKVKGYTRSDGTYVQSHYRTKANNTISDNYSTVGNTNPYTGKAGTVSNYNSTSTYSTPITYSTSKQYNEEVSSGNAYLNDQMLSQKHIVNYSKIDSDKVQYTYNKESDSYNYKAIRVWDIIKTLNSLIEKLYVKQGGKFTDSQYSFFETHNKFVGSIGKDNINNPSDYNEILKLLKITEGMIIDML